MRGRDDDGSFSLLADADVALDTMEANEGLAARGSVLQSEIRMTSMERRDCGLGPLQQSVLAVQHFSWAFS